MLKKKVPVFADQQLATHPNCPVTFVHYVVKKLRDTPKQARFRMTHDTCIINMADCFLPLPNLCI